MMYLLTSHHPRLKPPRSSNLPVDLSYLWTVIVLLYTRIVEDDVRIMHCTHHCMYCLSIQAVHTCAKDTACLFI